MSFNIKQGKTIECYEFNNIADVSQVNLPKNTFENALPIINNNKTVFSK